jgi:membrane associated rhomboid family serine protease
VLAGARFGTGLVGYTVFRYEEDRRHGHVRPRPRADLMFALAYAVIGAFVAAANHYFSHVGSTRGVVSAILAILVWPLVLIGIDIRIR